MNLSFGHKLMALSLISESVEGRMISSINGSPQKHHSVNIFILDADKLQIFNLEAA
jgi:hypothetical protein